MESTLLSGDQAQDRANSGNGRQGPLRGNKRITCDEIVLRNRLTALVVDNVRICRILHQGYLQSYGFETRAVKNGSDAVELIASGAKFDLIVIDRILPIVNGIETTRQIRAMGVRCKIVGVHAIYDEEERRAFLEAGADVFVEKPMSDELIVSIRRELNRQ